MDGLLLWLRYDAWTLRRLLVYGVCAAGVLLLGGLLSYLSSRTGALALGPLALLSVLSLSLILLLRHHALVATLIVALHLYADWYLGLHLLAPLLACVFLWLLRHRGQGWRRPRACWLWLAFLLITIYPCWRGGLLMVYDAASFYPSDILGAFLMFWLGSVIVYDRRSLQTLFSLLTLLAVLLAVHLFIQAYTGIVLFQSSRVDTFLSSVDVAYYQLMDSSTHRVGSFFIDPNWAGAYFALSFFLPAGLFVRSSTLWQRGLSLLAMLVLLAALVLTYSTGAWVAFFVGMLIFLLLVGDTRLLLVLLCLVFVLALTLTLLMPAQLQLQLQHATANNELSLRIAAWQTALRVIQAYPLTGVGLGHQAYLLHAEPYRVPAQFVQLSHPHNSYLEWAAMGGIPVLLLFLLLLLWTHFSAWRNWRLADRSLRPLLGAGIAATVTLSVNSVSINGWTHFALAFFGWLILGAVNQYRVDTP
ncbi:O-antigen ligase family protein [Ktedonobacteria bacterium brp13]|nr:O-antigen ligase family protein [Ktedonobacteria bacterium brp13]